ncbi:MAG: hypothetical protein IPH57_07845 [Saprospiraceae bacterium]|nr:hypothetical protein [Saprospiraceae bacterium]
MKVRFIAIIVLILNLQYTFACAVCLGNITDDEIIAYTFSVIFLIALIGLILYLIFKKVIQNYDLDI